MNVLVGLALFALMLVAPNPAYRGRVWSFCYVLIGVLQGGVQCAVAMCGVYYAFRRSVRASVLAGAIVGGMFALLMCLSAAALVGYMFCFRRSLWVFGKAWSDADLSTL